MVYIRKCFRCNHQWASRGEKEPKVCSKCRSKYWNYDLDTQAVKVLALTVKPMRLPFEVKCPSCESTFQVTHPIFSAT